MATGFLNSNGVDLDDIFEPYSSGISPAATGFVMSNGIDINTRYAPRSAGGAASATGFQVSSGSDINTLFAAKGSVIYWDGNIPTPSTLSDSGAWDPIRQALGLIAVIFESTGRVYYQGNFPYREVTVGDWTGSFANGSNTEIRFSVLAGDSFSENNAPNWRSLSSPASFNVFAPVGQSRALTALIELRHAGNPASTISKQLTIYTQTHEEGGGGRPV